MGWKCPKCGTENDDHIASCHGMCGYVRYGKLVLVGATTGQEIRMNLDTAVGQSLLKRLVGEEARFASEPQFHLRRSEDEAAWLVMPEPRAVNATHVNGAKVGDAGVKVSDGTEITVGTNKALVKVRVLI